MPSYFDPDFWQQSFPVTIGVMVALYFAFRMKQLFCDFIFQTPWMIVGKSASKNWLKPLMVHAGIHGCATMLIVLFYKPAFWWLGVADVVVHAMIDRSKALLAVKRGWGPENTRFWWAHAIDQEAHNITHFGYILILILS